MLSSLCVKLFQELFKPKRTARFVRPSCMKPRNTHLIIMKRHHTDAGEEIGGEVILRSKYFPTIPDSNSGHGPRPSTESQNEVKVENETIQSLVTTPIESADIPVKPIRKKRTRTRQFISPVDTNDSVFIRQVCGSLSDVPKFIEESSKPESDTSKLTCGLGRCKQGFYDVSCLDLARNLLGQVLVRQLEDGTLLKGRIVETECYLGGEDAASHSHNGKITDRNTPMYMKPGTAYVYLTYGMYHCFNISSQGPGAAVLLRALDPLVGTDSMFARRTDTRKKTPQKDASTSKKAKALKLHELCNGPAKLCISFDIKKLTCNKRDLSTWDGMWVEKSTGDFEVREHHIVKTQRIGIDSAGLEWASKPLRFYLIDNKSVSRRDKIKEREMKEIALLLS